MKPPPFDYHRAGSVDEAVALLAQHGDDAKILAGGQSLVPLLSLRLARPSRLIDINRVGELAHIANGSGLTIGATVRQRAVERSSSVRAASPLLAAAVAHIGHSAIRNRGTVGGSIAHADPAAELPAVLLALDGEIEARSARGVRTIPAATFFEGFLSTALQPDELLTAVRIPERRGGWSFHEFSRRSGDFAIVGVAATIELGPDGRIREARLALSGVDHTPRRANDAEALLAGAQGSDELWRSAAQAAASPLDPPSDIHGSAAYRKHLAAALSERALRDAHARAKESS